MKNITLKKITAIAIISASIVYVSGCATTQNYALTVYSWQNVNISQLYPSWGYPNSTQTLTNGNQLVTYNHSTTVTTPTTISHNSTGTGDEHSHQHNSTTVISGGNTTTYRCTTAFEVNRNNIIINTSFKGNDCKADTSFISSHGYAANITTSQPTN